MISRRKFLRKHFVKPKANIRTKMKRKGKTLVLKHCSRYLLQYRAFLIRKFNAKNTIGTFNKLNFDCLVHITSFLELNDLTNLDKISKGFSSVTQHAYKGFKNFNFESIRSVTFEEGRVLLNKIGPHITSIKIEHKYKVDEDFEAFIDLMCQLCTNLENLYIFIYRKVFSSVLLMKMSKLLFPRLKSIEYYFPNEIAMEKCLETATVLQNLKLHGCKSGRCISKIKNLVSLSIELGIKLDPDYFTDFCLNNKNLVKLKIHHCAKLTSKSVTDITTNLLKLEELSIVSYEWTTSEYLKLANLPKLKKLQVGGYASNDVNYEYMFKKLAKKDLLQFLDISAWGFRMNNKLLKIVDGFNKLEVLKMNFNDSINDEILSQLGTKGNIKELHIQNYFRDPTKYTFTINQINHKQNLSSSGIASLIKKSPNIRLLDISYSDFIPNDFFYMVSKILKEQNRQHILKVFVFSTSIEHQFNADLIAEYYSWIRLNFLYREKIFEEHIVYQLNLVERKKMTEDYIYMSKPRSIEVVQSGLKSS